MAGSREARRAVRRSSCAFAWGGTHREVSAGDNSPHALCGRYLLTFVLVGISSVNRRPGLFGGLPAQASAVINTRSPTCVQDESLGPGTFQRRIEPACQVSSPLCAPAAKRLFRDRIEREPGSWEKGRRAGVAPRHHMAAVRSAQVFVDRLPNCCFRNRSAENADRGKSGLGERTHCGGTSCPPALGGRGGASGHNGKTVKVSGAPWRTWRGGGIMSAGGANQRLPQPLAPAL